MVCMQQILVTGEAGFIGSNSVHHLLQSTEASVAVLDKLTYTSARQSLASTLPGRVRLVVGDVADEVISEQLGSQLTGPNGEVVHFAAESHNDNNLRDPSPFVITNTVGTYVVLRPVRRHNVRLHHIPTDEVYGDLELNDPAKLAEGRPYRPSQPYSASTAGADHLVRASEQSFVVRATISSCSNNYDPWQHIEKFIPRQTTNVLRGERPKVYGTGANARDWIHTNDHSSAVRSILAHGTIGASYLIGANGERSNVEVVRALLRLCDGPEGDTDFMLDRAGHDLRYAIDATRLRTELGWEPVYLDFHAGLANTVRWYADPEEWWGTVKDGVESAYAARGQ